MTEKYQTSDRKSTKKFEELRRKQLAVSVPLPLVEVWEELQPEVEQLTGLAGLQIIRAVIEDEVTRRVGPRYQPAGEGDCLRWGQQPGYVVFAGQKVAVHRPRVRTREGQEVELETYTRLQHDGRRQRAVREGIVAGLTSRNYQRAVQSVLDGYGIQKSSVSREFVQASSAQLKKLCERNLAALDLVAILIDGIHFGKQVLVVALGIDSGGKKHVLGLWQGATENTVVVRDLLEDLVTRGLAPERRYLFVIDGAKALRAAIERVFGERAEVQRCQLHKRRNIAEYLPKGAQGDYDRRIRNAYAMTSYAEAKAELQKIFRQLERVNPSAARSLEETLTVHRLGVGELLRRSLANTNPIESCLSTVERVARNVKRWHAGDQALRWTATGLLEAERKFRKVKGFRELSTLQRKLNPTMTQQAQVA
ncbi:MAG TPA: IS256 family transposase [Candidatus Acidoferrales bacterium]|nr:IS256 family transposase [Candidatus Acidoferrales bacterium]